MYVLWHYLLSLLIFTGIWILRMKRQGRCNIVTFEKSSCVIFLSKFRNPASSNFCTNVLGTVYCQIIAMHISTVTRRHLQRWKCFPPINEGWNETRLKICLWEPKLLDWRELIWILKSDWNSYYSWLEATATQWCRTKLSQNQVDCSL